MVDFGDVLHELRGFGAKVIARKVRLDALFDRDGFTDINQDAIFVEELVDTGTIWQFFNLPSYIFHGGILLQLGSSSLSFGVPTVKKEPNGDN